MKEIFKPEIIMQYQQAVTEEQHQIYFDIDKLGIQDPKALYWRAPEINFGDNELLTLVGNPRRAIVYDPRQIERYTAFERYRLHSVLGDSENAIKALNQAYVQGSIDQLKSSAASLNDSHVPSHIANYYHGAFLARIADDQAKTHLEDSIEDGENRSINHLMYVHLSTGNLIELENLIIRISNSKKLNRYNTADVAFRLLTEDKNYAVVLEFIKMIHRLGLTAISQAIILAMISNNQNLIYPKRDQHQYQEFSNELLTFIQDQSKNGNPDYIFADACYNIRTNPDIAEKQLQRLNPDHQGHKFLQLLLAIRLQKPSTTKLRKASTELPVQCDLIDQHDIDFLIKYFKLIA